MDLLIRIIIAFITGSIGAGLAGGGGSRLGCLGAIFIGFLGSYVGSFVAAKLHLPVIFALQVGGHAYPIIWAIGGAIICVALLNLITRRR
ncbi:MAG: GlsB/YeaQ/YmgE family stress response membrane protein [Candidatus Eremiobacteraeota bacterium]|nr:GlsB/YeaQ/YmgE family stress response membrane protein [Candidatus Eremiobacteraeota bacterium]